MQSFLRTSLRAFRMLPPWLAAGILLAILALFITGLEKIGLVKPTPKEQVTSTVAQVPEEAEIRLGDDCKIKETCYGAVSAGAYEVLMKSIRAKDPDGTAELLAQELIVPISDGTRARLIEHGIFKRKVRLLSGAYAHQTFYVPREYVVTE